MFSVINKGILTISSTYEEAVQDIKKCNNDIIVFNKTIDEVKSDNNIIDGTYLLLIKNENIDYFKLISKTIISNTSYVPFCTNEEISIKVVDEWILVKIVDKNLKIWDFSQTPFPIPDVNNESHIEQYLMMYDCLQKDCTEYMKNIIWNIGSDKNIFQKYFKYELSKYIKFLDEEYYEDDDDKLMIDHNEDGENDKIYYERTNYYDLIDKSTLFSRNIMQIFGQGPYNKEMLSGRFGDVNCHVAALESNIRLLDWVHEGGHCTNPGNLDCDPKILSDISRQWIDRKAKLYFHPYQIRTIKDRLFDIDKVTINKCGYHKLQYQHDEGFAINIRNIRNWNLTKNGLIIGITNSMCLLNNVLKPLEQKYGKLTTMIHDHMYMPYHGYPEDSSQDECRSDAINRLNEYLGKPIDFIVEISEPGKMCITNVKLHNQKSTQSEELCDCEYNCDYGIDSDNDNDIDNDNNNVIDYRYFKFVHDHCDKHKMYDRFQ
jgi:hypothetical protein